MLPLSETEHRRNMRESLAGRLAGVFLPVGSVGFTDPDQAVREYTFPIARRHRVATWPQLPQRDKFLENMNISVLHHPAMGLVHDGDGHVIADMGAFAAAANLVEPGGADYDPEAAMGYHSFLRHARSLPTVDIVKSQIASPGSAFMNLRAGGRRESDLVQTMLWQAMNRGNTRALTTAVPGAVPIMSFDDPGGAAGSLEGMRIMFADDDDRPPALRGHHDCFGGPYRDLMHSGQVDLIHFEEKFAPNLVEGNQAELRNYLQRAGLFNIGILPNDQDTLVQAAAEFRPAVSAMASGPARNKEVADALDHHMSDIAGRKRERFSTVVRTLADGSGMGEKEVARQCAVSGICGMGDLADLRLQRLALLLADKTSDHIQDYYN